EIFVAFGRLGLSLFACEAANVVPDILTLSKALTGGTVPLAATIARRHVFDAFLSDDSEAALMHGPTYMGNAIACAAANASLDLFESEPRVLQARSIERTLKEEFAEARTFPGVVDVRCRGALGVIEIDATKPLAGLAQRFADAGVFVRPFRNIVYLTPPLTIEPDELKRLAQTTRETLRGWLTQRA
ncbi:MAG: aminotransferase class III-fold pyridoxal phosphate-dependent enzyme, partial [Pseudomonadota bacterium]